MYLLRQPITQKATLYASQNHTIGISHIHTYNDYSVTELQTDLVKYTVPEQL